MSAFNNGGPAFPVVGHFYGRELGGQLDHGMSLRDWFAGQALTGIRPGDWASCKDGAQWCYDFADAMLAARKEGQP